MDEIKAVSLLLRCVDAADDLYDELFAEQDLWSDPKLKKIHAAACRLDDIIRTLERETGYVRQENRA